MESLIWPPWMEIAAGLAGLPWSLAILSRLEVRVPRKGERLNAFVIFSVLLLAAGMVRWAN